MYGIPFFTFKKVDGRWTAMINGKLAFHMETVYGVPHEVFVEVANKKLSEKSPLERLRMKIMDWEVFARENGIDVSEFRKENQQNKGKILSMIEEMQQTTSS